MAAKQSEPDDKTLWDRKYSEAPEKWREPDPFLIRAVEEFVRPKHPGLALDVAGGAGRQAIWLAAQGWRVRIIDISDVGLRLAQHNAARVLSSAQARRSIMVECVDLNASPDLGQELYDLVIVFRYLNRGLFPALIRALKPGGTLIYSSFTIAQQQFANGPHDKRFLLQPGELRQGFDSLQILDYAEKCEDKGIAELVARKASCI